MTIGSPDQRLRAASEDGIHYGYVNGDLEWTIQPLHEKVQRFSEEEGLAAVKPSSKWGYINEHGETIIPFWYEDAEPFRNDRAIVSENRKYGLIDPVGRTVVPLAYEEIRDSNVATAPLYLARRSGKWGAIDPDGNEVIPCIFSHLGLFSENGLACASLEGARGIARPREGKYGFIDARGVWVIPPPSMIMPPRSPIMEASAPPCKLATSTAFITATGELREPLYDASVAADEHGNLYFRSKDGTSYCIDSDGARW